MRCVLVTGAAGFIGRHVLRGLRGRAQAIHAVGRTDPGEDGVAFHPGDLLDHGRTGALVRDVAPSHLIHLAWCAEPGTYWRSPQNLDWTGASLALARAFAEGGGSRFVGAGTCAEYGWGPPLLHEETSPREPATLYGAAKDATFRTLRAYAETCGLSLAWGRVFYLYGPGEARGRLLSEAVTALLAGQPFEASAGTQRRDFLHVRDVADAFVVLSASDIRGAVNIGSGEAPTVRGILERAAAETGRPDLIRFGARPIPAGDPAVVAADIRRLAGEVGFRPRFTLESGIADTVAWWRGTR